jgi:hypothetical protein
VAAEPMLVAKGERDHLLLPRMGNRHGLVAGATGTGKTVTLRVIAEQFSENGVPVFMADVKGDLAGMCRPGGDNPRVQERAKQLKLEGFEWQAYPVVFWDLHGALGHPVRTTVSEMGPLLLSRILNLNETQSGVLSMVFRIADDNGLLLLDLKDLRAMLQYVADNARQFTTEYGNVAPASVGAIQRGLLALEQQGADQFFGEPALDLNDFLQTEDGKGVINILAADKLLQAPRMYATFLLWLLAELFERLPEVGDPDKPRLVFFFDEAHLLFDDVPRELEDRIVQVVRVVRSKGVGVYFVTQNPIDIPDVVLGQLGNRVQHALRAYTPRDQKAVRSAAETFRSNPKLEVEEVISQLGVGEALVSLLDEKGVPTVVDRAFVCPPRSQLAPLEPAERQQVIQRSTVRGAYEKTVDRESAYEMLKVRAEKTAADEARADAERQAARPAPRQPKSDTQRIIDAFLTTAARGAASVIVREIMRGVLGSLTGSRRR